LALITPYLVAPFFGGVEAADEVLLAQTIPLSLLLSIPVNLVAQYYFHVQPKSLQFS
jgi:hypothetical protein